MRCEVQYLNSTLIYTVLLYGCETRSFLSRENNRLSLYEKKVGLRGRLEKITQRGTLYCSPNIFRAIKRSRIRWVGHVARTGNRRGVYRVLVGNTEGKRPLARARCRWNANIIVVITERAWDGEDGIDLA